MNRYMVFLEPLPDEEGGGYLAIVPDLPGCMSDGDTPEEAAANAHDAIESWLATNDELGRAAPRPGERLESARREREAWMETLRAAIMAIEARDGHIAGLERHVEHLTRLLERDPADRFGIYATSSNMSASLEC